MFERRLSMLLLVLAAASCERAPSSDAERLRAAFDAASSEYEVPRAILEGIGYAETRWWVSPEPANDGGLGLMHLVDRGPGSPLWRASELTGLTRETLATNLEANVRGAAALLREEADRFFADAPGRDPSHVEAWFQIVMAKLGADDARIAESYALGVFQAIGRGAAATLDDGTTYVLGPRTIDLANERIFRNGEIGVAEGELAEYPGAAWREALRSTTGRSGAAIDRVVIHTAQGSYNGTVSWFQNPQVQASSHYVIRSTDVDQPVFTAAEGDVTQMVQHADTAWHAGEWAMNQRSIGIEHEGFVKPAPGVTWFTDAMYRASANLVIWICNRHQIPRDRSHILGHYEVPGCSSGQGGGGGCHTDPCYYENGQLKCVWDWEHYMSLVGGTTEQQGTMKGFVFSGSNCTTPSTASCTAIQGATVSVPESGAAAVTGANGAFEFRLPIGKYNPLATAPGFEPQIAYLDQQLPVAQRGRVVTSGQITWSSFVLASISQTATITGFVFEKRANLSRPALEGVTIVAGGTLTTTGIDGRFSLVVPAGSVRVVASKHGFDSATQDLTIAAGDTGTLEIALLPEGSGAPGISGHIVDAATGLGVMDAVITIGDQFMRSEVDGRFTLDVAAGEQSAAVQAVGYVTRAVALTIPATGRTTREISLAPTAPSALLVITAPASGASVTDPSVTITGLVRMRNLASLNVNRVPLLPVDGAFSAPVALVEGENELAVTAMDLDGLLATASLKVSYVPTAGSGDDDSGCGCASAGLETSLLALAGVLVRRRRR